MRYLRTNTATRITVGPFLDKTDGITPEIALTVTSELLTFVVDTAGVPTLVLNVAPTASGGANDMVHITSDAAGYYDLELAAADVNYLGRATLSLNNVATHLPVFHEFMIVPAVIYDAMILGTDLLDVSVTQVNGAAQTATLDTIKAETVLIVADTNELQTDDYPTSIAAVKTDTAAILVDTAVIGALGAGLTALSTQTSVDAIKAETALIVADTNELQTDDYPTSIAAIKTDTAAILVDTGTTLDAALAVVDSNIDAILVDTGTDGVLLTAAAVDAVHDEIIEGALTLRHVLKIALSALAGKSTGGGTSTIRFRDNADSKARITATVDANGNRTSITIDGA